MAEISDIQGDGNQAHKTQEAAPIARPLLIYDGDCGFCGYWQRYWQKLTGDAVDYRPFQDVAQNYPEISREQFRGAVQYIAPSGYRAHGAEASFLTLSNARGKEFWIWLYRNVPGFAWITETAYAFIAAHRSFFYRPSVILWGRNYEPPRYDLIAFLFLRVLGLIYFSAFVSFAVQAQGLIGSHGILPLQNFVDVLNERLGAERYFLLPMVFWFNTSDFAIHAVCWAGAAFSLLIALNLLTRTSLVAAFILYLSIVYAGQTFMTFQWDFFLLEAGFLGFILCIARRPAIWLLRWLLFRFMFMGGMVKLLSDDPTWWNLSALNYHFLTQPLPTPLAWYAARIPESFLKFGVAATFVIEIILPFFFFFPRRMRFFAAFGTLLLQSCIALTGNYNWFNFLTMLLCLTLFDDQALRHVLPQKLLRHIPGQAKALVTPKGLSIPVNVLGAFLVFTSLVQMDARFGGKPFVVAQALSQLVEPFHFVSPYGPFAVMTTARNEIVIEGSNDGVNWREYEFVYKPGNVARAPLWNVPHQPRLDWQMWFAALDNPQNLPWFWSLIERLLQNEPSVTALFETNPFPDKPAAYVRAEFFDYIYSSPEEKALGIWWDRKPIGLYFPVMHLKGP